jgi:hypothetical protein
MQVPLAAVLSEGVADVDFEPADHRAWSRRGAHNSLVENCAGIDLTVRPRPGLPGPPLAGRA